MYQQKAMSSLLVKYNSIVLVVTWYVGCALLFFGFLYLMKYHFELKENKQKDEYHLRKAVLLIVGAIIMMILSKVQEQVEKRHPDATAIETMVGLAGVARIKTNT